MALTQIQKDVMATIAGNRSETSYIAGGLVLNMNWQRMSDDIDIFHDTDEVLRVSIASPSSGRPITARLVSRFARRS